MSAAAEIRGRAELFGWDIHLDRSRNEDTFIHGPHMIAVNYRRDGTVDRGERYFFYRIDEPQLRETTKMNAKKLTVVSWLSRLGS